MLQGLTETDFLILDDLGAQADRFRSGEHIERLRQVLDAREKRWTVATTNILPAQWAEVWDARVSDRFLRCAKRLRFEEVISFAVWKKRL